MKIIGDRDDGVQLLEVGAGLYLLYHPCGCKTRPLAMTEAVRYGPYRSRAVQDRSLDRALDFARLVDAESFARSVYGRNATYRALAEQAKAEGLNLSLDEYEHPFTHCMDSVVPKMKNPPDDPEAFCAWLKKEQT